LGHSSQTCRGTTADAANDALTSAGWASAHALGYYRSVRCAAPQYGRIPKVQGTQANPGHDAEGACIAYVTAAAPLQSVAAALPMGPKECQIMLTLSQLMQRLTGFRTV
jgi:hypothetical protein